MKKLIFLLVVSLFSISFSFGQCTPDPYYQNAGPGIYPGNDSLECFVNGQFGSITITYIDFAPLGGLPIDSTRIDSIVNLPFGLTWQTDQPNNTFYIGDNGCILIAGIPNDVPNSIINDSTGGYPLSVFVTLWIAPIGEVSAELSAIGAQVGGGNYDSIRLSLINPGGICPSTGFTAGTNLFEGQVFYDANGNGTKDSGEFGMANRKLILNPGGFSHYTNANGDYQLYLPAGTFSVELMSLNNFSISTATNPFSINFTGSYNISSTNDFGLTPTATIDEVQVSLDGGPVRPGFNARHTITYENTGTTIQSGNINYCQDYSLIVNSAQPNWDTQTGSCYGFNFTNLYPGEQRRITVNLTVPQNVNLIGDTLCSSATVTLNISTNGSRYYIEQFCQIVTGSYDPNDKMVTIEKLPDLVLNYRIRFQNSGTDTAFTIVVRDTLDQWFDINSFQMVAASHDYQFAIENGNVAVWTFNNVLLPDSNVNEPGSHGFIKYRLKLKNTFPSTGIITNQAAIYFDYNPPIFTNTVISKLGVGILEVELLSSTVYPNPTNNTATIEWNTHLPNFTFELFDVSGRKVIEENSQTGNSYLLNKGNLQEGFYIYQISSEGKNIGQGKVVFY